jgi:hypothetical protein
MNSNKRKVDFTPVVIRSRSTYFTEPRDNAGGGGATYSRGTALKREREINTFRVGKIRPTTLVNGGKVVCMYVLLS